MIYETGLSDSVKPIIKYDLFSSWQLDILFLT